MRFLTVEYIAPSVCISAFVISMSLFYFDLNRKGDAGNREKLGVITFRQSVAQRQYENQVVWEEIDVNTFVYNNDSIRTADLSGAHIQLNDGTLIKLAPNSLIRLVLSRDTYDIDFQQGSVSAKRDAAGKQLNIKSKDTVVSINDADLSLSQEKGKGLNILVNKGSANINKDGQKTEIKENQEAVLSKDRMDIHQLSMKLLTPEQDKYILTKTRATDISFSWETLTEGFEIFFEISDRGDFSRVLVRRKPAQNSTPARLELGNYFWRISAFDRKTNKTAFSETRRFTIVSDLPVILISPRDNSSIMYRSDYPIVSFRWTESTIASSYNLTISGDQELNNPIKKITLKGTDIAIRDLGSGTYFWRVETLSRLGSEEHVTSTAVQRLVITQNMIVDPPVPVYPADNQKLNQLTLSKKSVIFSWNKNPEIERSKFVIARDKDFNDIIHTQESNLNYSRFQSEIPVGVYFWRVAGFLKGSTTPVYSSISRFSVARDESIRLIEPGDNSIFLIDNSGAVPVINFSWNRTGLTGKYRLMISNNQAFTSIYRQLNVEGLATAISGMDPGLYFWQVEFYDEENVLLMKSGVRSVVMLDRLFPPEILEPAGNEVMDMSKRNDITLKWKDIKGADEYKISIYQVKGGKNVPVAESSSGSSTFVFKELNKLDEGEFLWTVQAIDNSGAQGKGKVLRRSPVVKSNFKITLGKDSSDDLKKMKPPKVLILK